MKPLPFLLGAALIFWGWQSDLLLVGMLMALIIESARFTQTRWDLADEDFSRIWTFCGLFLLAAAVFAFASNDGPSNFTGLFSHPNLRTERSAGVSTARTMALIIRWLPMIFFLFIGAQTFSTRESVPLRVISLIMRRRWKKARKLGQPLPYSPGVNISFPYFALCLAAAAVHTPEDNSYYWGFCLLVAWGLWAQRPSRYGLGLWASALSIAIALGYYSQGGIGRLQRYVDTLNPSWLTGNPTGGFDPSQSRTAIGQIGRIKASSKIVIRLEPKNEMQVPHVLREASYRTYKAETWSVGNSKNEFENVLSETNNTTWKLLRDKSNTIANANIACYLPGGKALLPLPEGSAVLENCQAYLLQKNTAGAVLAQGPGLLMYDALYGPGATMDSAPDQAEDTYVPSREVEGLERVITDLHLRSNDPNAIPTIRAFLATNFSYSTWQDKQRRLGTNETLISRFLHTTRKGHCEYFATATVLLLRELNIPARYAVGYAVHEISGKNYVIRQRDAHAWCLVWNRAKKNWEDLDTTPSSWLAEESRFASPLQALSDLWSRIRFEIARVRWGQTHLRQYLLWALVPVLTFLLFQILFRARRKRKGTKKGRQSSFTWPGLDSEFYLLERALAQRGLVRDPGEPLSRWLIRATSDASFVRVQDQLRNVLRLHYRYRFDPAGLNENERNALRQEARLCLKTVTAGSR
jgi:protein-glutamine gamma-glutamyltransferase